MNLTRRNILKALGIGAAVSVSGVSIAKEPSKEQQAITALNGILKSWSPSVNYTVGAKEYMIGSDGKRYQAVAENGMYTISRLSNV